MDSTQAFAELAGNYGKFRPGYPEPAMRALRDFVDSHERADWPARRLLIDVGTRTGISTRAMAEAFGTGHDVVGVEPGGARGAPRHGRRP